MKNMKKEGIFNPNFHHCHKYIFATDSYGIENLVKTIKSLFGFDINIIESRGTLGYSQFDTHKGVNDSLYEFKVNKNNYFNGKSFMRMCIENGLDDIYDSVEILHTSGVFLDGEDGFTKITQERMRNKTEKNTQINPLKIA